MFVWLRGKIQWCYKVVGSCDKCEVQFFVSSQLDKNLYVCVYVRVHAATVWQDVRSSQGSRQLRPSVQRVEWDWEGDGRRAAECRSLHGRVSDSLLLNLLIASSVFNVLTAAPFVGQMLFAMWRLQVYACFVAGPAIWNWLPDSLRNPAISRDSLKRSLKTFLFSAYSCT